MCAAPDYTRPMKWAHACAMPIALVAACGGGQRSIPAHQNPTQVAASAPAGAVGQENPAGPAQDGGEPGRVTIHRAFWIPGEQMFFAVSIHGVTGVRVTLAVGQPGRFDQRDVVVVRSQAETSGIVDLVKNYSEEATTQVAMDTCTPLTRQAVERWEGRETIIDSRFADAVVEHTRRRDGGGPYTWTQSIPAGEPIYDNQTILGLVRSWMPTRPGTRAYFYAVTDELLHRHEIRFSGYEDIHTALGNRHARRYDVDVFSTYSYSVGNKRSDQSYTIWISDDHAQVPLLLAVPHRYGRIEMELVAYSRPHPNGTGVIVLRAAD